MAWGLGRVSGGQRWEWRCLGVLLDPRRSRALPGRGEEVGPRQAVWQPTGQRPLT